MFPLTPMPRRARRMCWIAVLAVVVLLAAFSNSFGRAEPVARYRPALQNAALETGCYPLPEGVHFDFAHQVRRDGDVETDTGLRRRLVVQWDLVDQEAAQAGLIDAFTRAGFEVVDQDADSAEVTKPGVGPVSWELAALDVADDVLVQGTIVFDLPSIPAQSDDPQCSDRFTTKRFTSRSRS